jgi:hypothetical protein
VNEGAEIQTKGIENLFNEIRVQKFSNLCDNIDTHAQEAFYRPNRCDHKRKTP